MKAIDYYNKYKDEFYTELAPGVVALPPADTLVPAMQRLFSEFVDEGLEMVRSRNIVRRSAYNAVVKEQNQKWNALAKLFLKSYGISVINENGFDNILQRIADDANEQIVKESEKKIINGTITLNQTPIGIQKGERNEEAG